MSQARTEEVVQEAARALFLGSIPERAVELEELWNKYGPCFELHSDTGPNGTFVLEAGLFKFIRFNHRVMRVFWLAAFIAWEGYEQIHAVANDEAPDFDRFKAMIDTLFEILDAEDSASVTMPTDVPEPGVYPDSALAPKARAPAELATLATGWAMLHELRHIQHQQDGTGASYGAPPEAMHEEELSCDDYATTFLLERVADYAGTEGVEAQRVHQKRQLGIYFSLFTMALIGVNKWDKSETHPALQTRIDGIVNRMASWRNECADALAMAAFEALRLQWPNVPLPKPL